MERGVIENPRPEETTESPAPNARPETNRPTDTNAGEPPRMTPDTRRSPEVRTSPEELSPKERQIAIRSINLKDKFLTASSDDILAALHRFDIRQKGGYEALKMKKYAAQLGIDENAPWEQYQEKIRELLTKERGLDPATEWAEIKRIELAEWKEEYGNSPEKRRKLYEKYDWIGKKIRARIADNKNYLVEWRKIDDERIRRAAAKYGGQIKNLPKSDGRLKESDLMDMFPEAYTEEGPDTEAREERMDPNIVSDRLFNQLRNGEIDTIVMSNTDTDAKLAVYVLTDPRINKLADKIRLVRKVGSGEWMHNAINVDTGNRPVGLTGEGNKTYFFDHHDEARTKPYAAAVSAFEFILRHDLIPDLKDGDAGYDGKTKEETKEWMQRFVDFANEEDNMSYFGNPAKDKNFYETKWSRTLYGLHDDVPFEALVDLFKNGIVVDGKKISDVKVTGRTLLPDAYLKSIKNVVRHKKSPLYRKEPGERIEYEALNDRAQEVSKEALASIDFITKAEERMIKDGMILEKHPKLGKVLIVYKDFDSQADWEEQRQPANNAAAYAMGYDTQITFSTKNPGDFHIQSRMDLGWAANQLEGKVVGKPLNIRGQIMKLMDKDANLRGNVETVINYLGLRNPETALLEKQEATLIDGAKALGFANADKKWPSPKQIQQAVAKKLELDEEKISGLILTDFLRYLRLASDIKKAMAIESAGSKERIELDGKVKWMTEYMRILERSLNVLGIKTQVTLSKRSEKQTEADERAITEYKMTHSLSENKPFKGNSWDEIIAEGAQDAGLDVKEISKLETGKALSLIDEAREMKKYGLTIAEARKIDFWRLHPNVRRALKGILKSKRPEYFRYSNDRTLVETEMALATLGHKTELKQDITNGQYSLDIKR